ncbi:MAG: ABC transporter permease, partial [Acidobacteriota bacterium]|nr:ABC transporter permease [Acidobacteriota bacterium]
LTLLVNVLVMGGGVSLALLYVGDAQLAASIWGAIYLIYLELAILTAIATLFSSFSSPALSALLTFFIFIIGHFSASLRDFAQNLDSSAAKMFFEILYYFLPNLSFFSFITNTANNGFPPTATLVGAFLYAVVYISILLVAAVMIFSRRNFK